MNDEDLLRKALESVRATANRTVGRSPPLSEATKQAIRKEFQRLSNEPRQQRVEVPSSRLSEWATLIANFLRPKVVLPLAAAAALVLVGGFYFFRPEPIVCYASITRGDSPREKVQLELRLEKRTVLFTEGGVSYTAKITPVASEGPNADAYELTPQAEDTKAMINSLRGELRLIRVEGRQRIRRGRDLSMAILGNGQRRMAGKSWEALPPELVFQPGQ